MLHMKVKLKSYNVTLKDTGKVILILIHPTFVNVSNK